MGQNTTSYGYSALPGPYVAPPYLSILSDYPHFKCREAVVGLPSRRCCVDASVAPFVVMLGQLDSGGPSRTCSQQILHPGTYPPIFLRNVMRGFCHIGVPFHSRWWVSIRTLRLDAAASRRNEYQVAALCCADVCPAMASHVTAGFIESHS